jgi:GAF domain-containing protein
VTVYDESTRKTHEVVAAKSARRRSTIWSACASAQRGPRLDGRAEPLPAALPRRVRGRPQKVVLSKRLPWPKMHPSLLVLPLLMHDRALGTLILGAKRRHAFGDAVRPTLEVLASHLA